jgi:hypothetical protein
VKFRIAETINLKTSKGKLELKPGQVVALPHDVAVKLLNGNKITPIGKAIYKVYSKILDAYLWVVATNAEMKKMLDEGIEKPIYTYDDITKLEGVSKEGLKAIHKIKRVFPGSTVEDIKHKNKDL